MKTAKISIIIPVYNAEKTICRMLDCLLAQSLNDFEILIVNDGSTDKTQKIIESYVLKDGRIRVFSQKNEGVAMARQMGMDKAQGEYCIHADADDWVEPTMLEDLYNKAKQDDADVVIADYFVNTKDGESMCRQQPSSLFPLDILQDMFNNNIFGSLWHKLVRTELYRKYRVKFFAGINHCEDLLIWVQLLQHQEIRVSYLPKAYYHYVANETSITKHFTRDTYDMRLRFWEKLTTLLYKPELEYLKEKAAFSIFTEGFIYDVLTKEEIESGLKRYKKQIKQLKSLKWRVGFTMLKYDMPCIAHKLIHY
ncbi:MAG: glycosyltransferase [Prevotella sp.]|nr:glycosyltransferase [Prevotella sp.]